MTDQTEQRTIVLTLAEVDGKIQAHCGVQAAEQFRDSLVRYGEDYEVIEYPLFPPYEAPGIMAHACGGLLPWRVTVTETFHDERFVIDENTDPGRDEDGFPHDDFKPEDYCDIPPTNNIMILTAYAPTRASALALIAKAGHHANAVIFGELALPDGVHPFDPAASEPYRIV